MRPTSSGSSECPMPGLSSRTRFTKRSSAAVPTRSIPAGEARKRRPITTAMIAAGRIVSRCRTRFSPCRSRRPVRRLRLDRRAADRRDRRVLPVHPARRGWTKISAGFSARRMPACSGPSSFIITAWSSGSTATRPGPEPPPARRQGRNAEWQHVYNLDVLSVPDKWEYPWFAAWDTAFHCIVLARLDPEWAKRQVVLLLREWYMHPSGQLPAYEWDFSDANPPVHAHAARRVYEITRELTGEADTAVSRRGLSQAAAQFHLVGQPQGPRGTQRLSGGLSRPGQHRRVRPQPAQPGRGPAARAGRWDRLDGDVLPRHAGDRARTVSHPAGLRGDRHQVLRALRGHLARHQRVRWRDRHVGPGRRFLLRRGPGQGRSAASTSRSARSWA